MTRFALMLLASALMLIVAACETDGDDEDADNGTDDTTTEQTDGDSTGESEEDTVVPEDDESTETEDDAADSEEDEVAEGTGDPTEESTNGAGEDNDEAGQDQEGTGNEGQTGDDSGTEGEDQNGADEDAVDPDQQESGTPEADPNEGIFFDLTVEEANDMTEFEVREPAEIPDALEFQTIMGMASQQATEEEMEDEAATVTFAYQQPPEGEMAQGLPVEFMQSSELDMSQGLGEEAEQEEVTIGDRDVTRITMAAQTGDEILAYVWTEDDVHFSLAAILGGDLQESDLEAMIESVPAA